MPMGKNMKYDYRPKTFKSGREGYYVAGTVICI